MKSKCCNAEVEFKEQTLDPDSPTGNLVYIEPTHWCKECKRPCHINLKELEIGE